MIAQGVASVKVEMVESAMKIWAYPKTSFVPSAKEFDSCTLDDENFDLTGRDIVRYRYLTTEQPVASWIDMFEHIVKFLHQKDKSVLMSLVYSKKEQLANAPFPMRITLSGITRPFKKE